MICSAVDIIWCFHLLQMAVVCCWLMPHACVVITRENNNKCGFIETNRNGTSLPEARDSNDLPRPNVTSNLSQSSTPLPNSVRAVRDCRSLVGLGQHLLFSPSAVYFQFVERPIRVPTPTRVSINIVYCDIHPLTPL